MSSIQDELAARKAARENMPISANEGSSMEQELAERKAVRDTENYRPPIDYSNKREIGDLNMSGVPLMDQAKAAGGLLLDARPEAQVKILEEHLPGIESAHDDEGNVFVTYKDKQYYLNKPGLSGADVNQLMADAVAYLPASKFAAIGKSVLARFGIGVASYGATSAASDLGGAALGSEQGVDPIKAGIAAIFGGTAEAVTPFVISGVKRLFNSSKLYNAKTGLTDLGKKMIKDLGFNYEVFNASAAREFARFADGGIDPKTAAGLAENKIHEIPVTRGEALQDHGLIQKEELARTGGLGDKQQKTMQALDEKKTTATLQARDKAQEVVGRGETTISGESEGGGVLSEAIKSKASKQNDVINKAYEEAAKYDARLSIESLKDLSKNIASKLDPSEAIVDSQLTPSTIYALKTIKDIAKGKNVTQVTIKRLEMVRRKLLATKKTAANATDKRQVNIIREELDNWLDDAFDRSLFEGDEAALEVLKTARSARRKYGDLYQSRGKGDVAGKAINDIIEYNADEKQALNYLFGLGKLGGKSSANKVAGRVKEILGPDSPAWMTFRETAFLRLMKDTSQTHNGKTTFNGDKFIKAFDAAVKDSPELMKTIFDDALPYVKSLRNAIDRSTFRPRGTVNSSFSGVAASKMVQDVFKRLAVVMGLTGDLVSFVALNGASEVSGKLGKNYAKGIKPELPSSGFAAALAAASGEAGVHSQFPQQ